MKKYIPFLSLWATNFIILYFASSFVPENLVFGNSWLTLFSAIVWTALFVTLITWFSMPLADKLGLKIKDSQKKFVLYWGANSFALWFLAKLPSFSGFGISNFYWAIIVGLILNFFQLFVWRYLEQKKLI